MIDELAHLAEALATLGDLTPRSLDAISVVRREDVVAARASRRSCRQGVPAVHVDACEVMITDAHVQPRRAAGRRDRRRRAARR